MRPKELHELGYPTDIERLMDEAPSVVEADDCGDHFEIRCVEDDGMFDRFLPINKEAGFKESYFQFFGNEVDRERISAFARNLPPILFMNLKRVYFVEREEDLEGEVEEDSENHTFYFGKNEGPLEMAVYCDSTAFINLRAHRKVAKEEFDADRLVGLQVKEYDAYFYSAIFQTLGHELFHLAQFNPLIESLIPAGEEAAEEFGALCSAV